VNSTFKQRWPKTRYSLTLTIALLVQLSNACSVIGQDDAGENAVADNAATPELELNDSTKPSLNDLIDRLAAIENLYRRFNIRWHETSETNPDLPAEFKPLWPNRREILLNYAQSQIGLREWVDHRESYTNGVRTKWSQRFATEKGILSTNDEQPTPASATPFDADGRNEFLIPAPFEGIYALHDTGLKRSLLSQRIQDNPGRTSLEWIDDDAKLTILFEDGPIRPRRVEVWLSHKHNWHPIRMRWFHPSSSKNVPFQNEWEVTIFNEASGDFRVKAGVQRFPLDLRSMSNTSNIAARERLKKLANESEQRNEALPIAYTTVWAIEAATYGDEVKAPLTWIEVDEDPHPPAAFSNFRSPPTSLQLELPAEAEVHLEDSAANVARGTGVSIAEYRRRLNALEIPLLQLAEKTRNVETSLGKDHPESLKQRTRLRESIQKTFATRQEIQRAELTEFARRLSRMQQSIDARDRIADKVIDRRLEELLDPNVGWTQLSTPLVQSESTSPIQPPEPKNISEVSAEKHAVSVIGGPKKLLVVNSIEAEITFTIPGEERKVFYWRGFPIDGTNTAVVARDNMRPSSNAEQAKADLETFRKSVESIRVITWVDKRLRSLPAKIERLNSDLGLLLVSVEQDYVFESLPFDPVGPATGQRFETDPGTLRHWMISTLTNVSSGVKRAELSEIFPSKKCFWNSTIVKMFPRHTPTSARRISFCTLQRSS